MKTSTKYKAEGALHQLKGKVKEVVGQATDNPKLTLEGKVEKNAGKLERKAGDVAKALKK
jgi:uncharacterized protein YjbJ (UPF0337 family)